MKSHQKLAEYAALDPALHLPLAVDLKKKISIGKGNGKLPISESLEPNQKVVLTCWNKTCAEGVLVFVGGRDGEMRTVGGVTVGKSKSLVLIKKVHMKAVRPAFSHRVSAEEQSVGKKGWDHSKRRLVMSSLVMKCNSILVLLLWHLVFG